VVSSGGEPRGGCRGSTRPGRDASNRVGVFGGTFDPPRLDTAFVARVVADSLALGRLLWVPASIPPHKAGRTITPGAVRRRLVEAAVAHDPRFDLCDLELERGGVSYTVDTLRRLRADHPGWSLSLVLGSDLAGGLWSWKEPEAVLDLAELAVISRPGTGAGGTGGWHATGRVRTVQVTPVDISSSRVRERVRQGMSVCDMVSPTVLAIIQREGLYRD